MSPVSRDPHVPLYSEKSPLHFIGYTVDAYGISFSTGYRLRIELFNFIFLVSHIFFFSYLYLHHSFRFLFSVWSLRLSTLSSYCTILLVILSLIFLGDLICLSFTYLSLNIFTILCLLLCICHTLTEFCIVFKFLLTHCIVLEVVWLLISALNSLFGTSLNTSCLNLWL